MWKEDVGPKLRCALCGDKEPKVTRVLRNEKGETKIQCLSAGHVFAKSVVSVRSPPTDE